MSDKYISLKSMHNIMFYYFIFSVKKPNDNIKLIDLVVKEKEKIQLKII